VDYVLAKTGRASVSLGPENHKGEKSRWLRDRGNSGLDNGKSGDH
jgi:hypothetical protein